jgi:hypothetical protein
MLAKFAGRIWEGQENRGGAAGGVRVAGLAGHVSRSAVYLVHKDMNLEGLGPAPRGGGLDASAERLSKKIGCYHTRSITVM